MIGDLVDVGKGGKMRHMGNGGKNGIVFFCAHTESLRSDCPPQIFNQPAACSSSSPCGVITSFLS